MNLCMKDLKLFLCKLRILICGHVVWHPLLQRIYITFRSTCFVIAFYISHFVNFSVYILADGWALWLHTPFLPSQKSSELVMWLVVVRQIGHSPPPLAYFKVVQIFLNLPMYCFIQETVEDRKAVVRLLMKECPTYMVKLIAEIRHLGWIKESPFLRSK